MNMVLYRSHRVIHNRSRESIHNTQQIQEFIHYHGCVQASEYPVSNLKTSVNNHY